MKSYYQFTLKKATFSLLGLLAITATSCGSYQNVSYYDNDGVYGSDNTYIQNENRNNNQNTEQSNRYAQQFRSMRDDFVIFTDVDNYSSTVQDTVVTIYRNEYGNNNYAGWVTMLQEM